MAMLAQLLDTYTHALARCLQAVPMPNDEQQLLGATSLTCLEAFVDAG